MIFVSRDWYHVIILVLVQQQSLINSSQVTASNSYFTLNSDELFLPCQKDKKITDLMVKNFNTG